MKFLFATVISALAFLFTELGVSKLYDVVSHNDGDLLFSTHGFLRRLSFAIGYSAVAGTATHIGLKKIRKESYPHYALIGGLIPVMWFYARELSGGVTLTSFYDALWVLYFGSIGTAQGCAYHYGLDMYERKKE